MNFERHPRRAARDPLPGAVPAARQSRFRGTSGLATSGVAVWLKGALDER